MRRLAPALGLFLLAPLVAEFLLGNLPISMLVALVVLAPMYGGGAVLIREVVRRNGRGWPSILMLALAFGVLEEGIATMSLFNPDYAGLRLLDNGYLPSLGIGVPWTFLVLTLHVVWSISVPIATVEVLVPSRRTTPWLGRVGLVVMGLICLLGFAATAAVSIADSGFVATFPQMAMSGVIAAGLVLAGLFLVPPAPRTDLAVTGQASVSAPDPAADRPFGPMHGFRAGGAPSPWLVGVAAFVLSSAFKVLPLAWSPWLYVGITLGLALLAIVGICAWSRRPGWGDAHRLALAAGPLLTYAWSAFPQPPVVPASPAVDLAGNVLFAVGAIILILVAALRLRRVRSPGPIHAEAR